MMDNASPSLLVPLTLPTSAKISSGNVDPTESWNIVESSCSETRATVLVSWGLLGTESAESRGVALGCQDGTLYVFHPSSVACVVPQTSGQSRSTPVIDVDSVSNPPTPSRLAPRHPRPAYLNPRSDSPSLAFHQAAFNITSRSRAVSGLSMDQVEAPKNHVDFEDEPEKLKEMLKGKGARDKTVSHNNDKGLVAGRSQPPPLLMPSGSNSKRKDDARSLLSATNSPPFTPRSPSAPSSPILVPLVSSDSSASRYSLCLRFHIIPRRLGAVSAVQLLDSNRLLGVLQDNG